MLNFPGVLYRGYREGAIREWMVERNVVEKVVRIPGNTFEDTAVETALLVLRKGRTESGVIFRDELTGKERAAGADEIRANGFNLSVSCYVQPDEPESPPVDPYALELEAQDSALRRVKAEIDFSVAAAQIEGWDLYRRLIKKLQNLLDDEKDRMHISGSTA